MGIIAEPGQKPAADVRTGAKTEEQAIQFSFGGILVNTVQSSSLSSAIKKLGPTFHWRCCVQSSHCLPNSRSSDYSTLVIAIRIGIQYRS